MLRLSKTNNIVPPLLKAVEEVQPAERFEQSIDLKHTVQDCFLL
jgi:hypothetical protein